jgi:hypothetical protein
MSTKSGPAGQAITSSVSELTFLPSQLILDIKELGGERLGSRIDRLMAPFFGDLSLATIWCAQHKPKVKRFRKLSYFSDKEGKTRVIAILDYWSQTCLRGYHRYLNDVLRTIKSDRTFSQESIHSTISSSGPYFSFDLSAATDRMPLSLQKRVFARIFGASKSEAWARVLTDWEYVTKGIPSVKYNCGQPMGAYSSWPMMALTHHIIIQVAALRAGFVRFAKYAVLGDDVVINDSQVAEQYRKLCFELDMPISEAKTHVSAHTYEFAKRWFHNGNEVTPFSIHGLITV